jgi:GTP cyclohydrolase FolE2
VQTELLEDVQARTDVRSFRIDRAGVASLHHPMMTVLDRAHGVHHTVGTFSLSAGVPPKERERT